MVEERFDDRRVRTEPVIRVPGLREVLSERSSVRSVPRSKSPIGIPDHNPHIPISVYSGDTDLLFFGSNVSS